MSTTPLTPICPHEAEGYGEPCLHCGDKTWWETATVLQCKFCWITMSHVRCPCCAREAPEQHANMMWRAQPTRGALDKSAALEEGEILPGVQRIETFDCGCLISEKRMTATSDEPYWQRIIAVCAVHASQGVTTETIVPGHARLCDGCGVQCNFWEPLYIDHARVTHNYCPKCMLRFTSTCEQCMLRKHRDDTGVFPVHKGTGVKRLLPVLCVICNNCHLSLKTIGCIA
jgi:hypothetical protein